VALRNPYVDALSLLQVRALRTLRGDPSATAGEDAAVRRLLQITVSGVAAGLQNTG
jgi:phosphoenolpyruvate carboxylase